MPKVIETVKNVFCREPNKGVDPDEVVAIGIRVAERSAALTPNLIYPHALLPTKLNPRT